MKGSQLAVRCERVGYNAGMVANATTQIETMKLAIMPRADVRAGGSKSATVFNWSDADDNITVSSLSTHELHGFYIQAPSNVASVDQSNQQYSILALTDSNGNVSERYAYTAYGQPTFLNASATVQTSSAANNRYTYTAREWDATLGLHYFRAKWMSGLTGRFLTRDPIGYEGSPYNMYKFLKCTPLAKRDPSGLIDFGCDLLFEKCNGKAEDLLELCIDRGWGNLCYPGYYANLADCIANHLACKAAEAINDAATFCSLFPIRCVLVGGVLVIGGVVAVVEPTPAGEAAVGAACVVIVGGATVCPD